MSGPATPVDAGPLDHGADPERRSVEITTSREATVGTFRVRRALPRRARRTVGAWCFVDHMGPAEVTAERGLGVAPHPHIGLQTVTWLFAGQALHRDSLGSEQVIAPGQLNLMTAGRGVAHSEEGTGRHAGAIHGVQLWVAQPSATRDGDAAFEHHAELPRVELDNAVGAVLVGAMAGAVSPARRDTDHVGVELDLRPGTTTLPLRPDFEYGLVVCIGAVRIDAAHTATPGHLAYLGLGRDELPLTVTVPTRAMLVGGVPFDEPILMWWNFVARTQAEIVEARDAWAGHGDRFGTVTSRLPRIEVDPPPWDRAR